MRRANNTIPRDEYSRLFSEAAIRMAKRIARLAEEEESKMRACDVRGDYAKAEIHDFNVRALDMAWNCLCVSPDEMKDKIEAKEGC